MSVSDSGRSDNGGATVQSSSSNHLFIKSVSPLATVQSVKDFFEQAQLDASVTGSKGDDPPTVADDIECVLFVTYPQSKQKYCQVTFKTSAGVTSAMTLNGHLLHGVPTPLTVIDPGKSSARLSPAGVASLAMMHGGTPALSPAAVQTLLAKAQASPGGLEGSSQISTLKSLLTCAGLLTPAQATQLITHSATSRNQADQTAAMRSLMSTLLRASAAQNLTSEMLDVLNSLSSSAHARESEEQQIQRTLFITNMPSEWDENQLTEVLTDELALGTLIDCRIDIMPTDGKRFALVEFTSEDAVTAACRLPQEQREIISNELLDEQGKSRVIILEFEPARATVRPREPENVSFSLGATNVTPVPIAYQSISKLNLEEKLLRVRALANKMAQQRNESTGVKTEHYDEDLDRGDGDKLSHYGRRHRSDFDFARKRRRRYYRDERRPPRNSEERGYYRDREREHEWERYRERERDRDRERARDRDRDREREVERGRDKEQMHARLEKEDRERERTGDDEKDRGRGRQRDLIEHEEVESSFVERKEREGAEGPISNRDTREKNLRERVRERFLLQPHEARRRHHEADDEETETPQSNRRKADTPIGSSARRKRSRSRSVSPAGGESRHCRERFTSLDRSHKQQRRKHGYRDRSGSVSPSLPMRHEVRRSPSPIGEHKSPISFFKVGGLRGWEEEEGDVEAVEHQATYHGRRQHVMRGVRHENTLQKYAFNKTPNESISTSASPGSCGRPVESLRIAQDYNDRVSS